MSLSFDQLPDPLRTTFAAWEAHFDDQARELREELVRIRRHLHQHPEASGEEIQTTEYIGIRLEELGLRSRRCDHGLGLVVDLTLGRPADEAPLIAIRADIDALRLTDLKEAAYRSTRPGLMHACGHDAHTTMVLGTALLASRLSGISSPVLPLGARLRLIFQPAEEIGVGAEWLVKQNVLEGVNAILGVHVDPERLVGQVGIRYGMLTANCDEIEIRVRGRGGHGARPHHTRDPIAATAQLLSIIYSSLPRAVDSRDPAVISFGQIAGGYAPNVIPAEVELHGTLRTIDPETRKTLKRRLQEICAGVQTASECGVELVFHRPLKGVNNNQTVAWSLEESARRVLGSDNVQRIEKPSMGGEDFSAYLDTVPGAQLRLGCAVPGQPAPFLHSPHFDIDEQALELGTRILIRAALLLTLFHTRR